MRILKAGMIALASLVAIGALAGTLSAQGNSGNPVLQAIQTLQDTVNSLVTSATPGSVLFTPAVWLRSQDSDAVLCNAVNVTDTTRSVTLEVFNGATGEFVTGGTDPTLAAGKVAVIAYANPAPLHLYCKFTVNDGTKSDVRAALALFTVGTETTTHDPIAAQ